MTRNRQHICRFFQSGWLVFALTIPFPFRSPNWLVGLLGSCLTFSYYYYYRLAGYIIPKFLWPKLWRWPFGTFWEKKFPSRWDFTGRLPGARKNFGVNPGWLNQLTCDILPAAHCWPWATFWALGLGPGYSHKLFFPQNFQHSFISRPFRDLHPSDLGIDPTTN